MFWSLFALLNICLEIYCETQHFAKNFLQNVSQHFAPKNTTVAADKYMHRKEKTEICKNSISMESKSIKKFSSSSINSSHGGINSNGSKTSARISSCCSSRDSSKMMVES